MRFRITAGLLLWAAAASAQDRASQDQARFRALAKVVQVPVTVIDNAGRTVDGLAARDFLVLDNGAPQGITLDDFGSGLASISMVIAIQSSGTSNQALGQIRRIGSMIQPLVTGARGEAAVVSFDREIHWLQDFTRDPDNIESAVKSLKAGPDGARMLDTIAKSADRLRGRPGRKMLLLISQSRDAGSKIKFEQAAQIVEREGIEVFAAHYSSYAMSWIAKPGDFPSKPELDQMFYTELARIGAMSHAKALAALTGGDEYGFARRQGLEKAIQELGSEVRSQYILSFPMRDGMPGLHKIEVSMPERIDLRVRWRRAYWADAQNQ